MIDADAPQPGLDPASRLLPDHGARGLPADLRSYCCPICNGWHLTKIVDTPKIANLRDDRLRRIRYRHEVRERLEFIAARKAVDEAAKL